MVEVKICGLSTTGTMTAALDAGADFVGLVFYQPSPRNLSIEDARPLADIARGKAKIVALTVDPDDKLIDEIAASINPDFIQCHGSESPERIAEITARTRIAVIKTIKVRAEEDVREAALYDGIAAMMLYDAKVPEGFENPLPGGNGVQFDWSLLRARSDASSFMLAGGIDVENVAKAIEIAQPAIVDVSTGVETAPGQKDAGLIREFVAKVKSFGI
jgi:phosphoribosylanthranilate isomerase